MRLLPSSLLIANGPFGRHGPLWRIAAWQCAQLEQSEIAVLSSIRSNSWTTGPSGAGTGGATSTTSSLNFLRLPSEVSSSPAVVVTKKLWILLVRPPHCPVDASYFVFFAAPEAYRRGRLSNGCIVNEVKHVSHFNSSGHNWQLWSNQYRLRSFLIIMQ